MAEDDTPPHVEATPPRIERPDMTRFVRVNLRPPARFAAGADFKLSLTRFEMYVRQADIAEDQQRVKELLALLEDEPFRVVSQRGLLETGDCHAVTECLHQHYAPEGNWNGSTSYRLEFRSLEKSWQISLELFMCSPTRPTPHGLLNSDKKF